MDIKTLIYSKGFDEELRYKLLHIADSSTMVEDLIDLLADMARKPEVECAFPDDCSHVEELEREKEELEEEFHDFKSSIKDDLLSIKEDIESIMDECE